MSLLTAPALKGKERRNTRYSIPPNQTHNPPTFRNPARHATGERPLQSESSLKCHLQRLRATATSLTSQASGCTTAAFGLGAIRGDLNGDGFWKKWNNQGLPSGKGDGATKSITPHLTFHYGTNKRMKKRMTTSSRLFHQSH